MKLALFSSTDTSGTIPLVHPTSIAMKLALFSSTDTCGTITLFHPTSTAMELDLFSINGYVERSFLNSPASIYIFVHRTIRLSGIHEIMTVTIQSNILPDKGRGPNVRRPNGRAPKRRRPNVLLRPGTFQVDTSDLC